MEENKKKGGLTTLLLVVILIAGLSLLLYPTVSNYWNRLHASQAIASYAESVANLDEKDYSDILYKAHAYNDRLAENQVFELSPEQMAEYEDTLDITGTGVMGYIEIPCIGVYLPVYHGTGEAVLQIAVGHVEWTSLPVGGSSAHCVLSGHRGLPSAKLFTNLDKVAVGDTFLLYVLNEKFTYLVDNIVIVEPQEVSSLQIHSGEDLCTLVTCTPYGINTHRMLVTGHRVENAADEKLVITPDAWQISVFPVAMTIGIILFGLDLLISSLVRRYRRNH